MPPAQALHRPSGRAAGRQPAPGLCTCPLLGEGGLLHLLGPPVCKMGGLPHTAPRNSSWAVLARRPTHRDGQSTRWQGSACPAAGLPGATAGQSLPGMATDGNQGSLQ